MPRTLPCLALACAALLAAPLAHAGVDFEGMLQADGYWYGSDGLHLDGDPGDGTDTDFGLRRAELVLKGKGPAGLDWTLGYDAAGDGKFLDAYARYRFAGERSPYLQLGQFKQPNGLEELSSGRHNDFIAKAMLSNTFAVSRRLGIGSGLSTNAWGLTASVFTRELTHGRAHGPGYGLRGWWAPLHAEGRTLHLGLSHVDADTDADTLRLRARPDADMARRLVDTGPLAGAGRVATTGLEALWLRGAWKLQGEAMRARVSREGAAGAFDGTGAYASAVWNLTGEAWRYKGGTPALPEPAAARGLWQLGLRFDTLDLDDGAVAGGSVDTWTVGVNWYWRAHLKLALDHVRVRSTRNGATDTPSILEARLQYHW